jgi:hypothetical protein
MAFPIITIFHKQGPKIILKYSVVQDMQFFEKPFATQMVHCHKDIIKLAKMWAEMQD